MDNNEYEDVFQRACLIQLSTAVWQGSRQIDQHLLEKINANSNWLRGRKYLIDPEILLPVRTLAGQARNAVAKYSYSFPIPSVYLIPKENLAGIDEQLQEFQIKFQTEVMKFEDAYSDARYQARQVLGKLFNEADYPVDIHTKFHFQWRFISLGIGQSQILTPEIYQREKQKFQEMMEETRDIAASALREDFSQVLESLVKKLHGKNGDKPKKLSDSMFNKLEEFLDEFSVKNIFRDEKLTELTQQARNIINSAAVGDLNTSNSLMRRRIEREVNRLQFAVEEAIEEMPRRKIRMAM
jgi:hypothetical protein